jgi:hypothetical protein
MPSFASTRLSLTAGVHNNFPQGGGTLWRHTSREDRLAILHKFPQRTDLDLHAPYGGHARPATKVDRKPHKSGESWLEHTAPKD